LTNVRAAVLDRDATLIDLVRDEETGAICTAFHPSQLRLLTGVVEGLRLLQAHKFVLAIATNQPGPAKGYYSEEAVKKTNAALVALLAKEGVVISEVRACCHHPVGAPSGNLSLTFECDCRKPKPGMLRALSASLGFDVAESWMIGDGEGDVLAGQAAGMRTGLIFADNRCELCPLRAGVSALVKRVVPDAHGATLLEVAQQIVRVTKLVGPRQE
jgi:D-glycero-D-manno-heptose 1,7-bisphosphate phosphatase